MRAKCERCGEFVVGDYDKEILDNVKINIICKQCLFIDIKVSNPDANVQCLLERDDND